VSVKKVHLLIEFLVGITLKLQLKGILFSGHPVVFSCLQMNEIDKGRRGARWHKVTFTSDDFLGLSLLSEIFASRNFRESLAFANLFTFCGNLFSRINLLTVCLYL